MTEYITGGTGIGKTKLMTATAIETSKISNGNIVYIDSTDKLMYILPNTIRLIDCPNNISESTTAFVGFLFGLCQSDYDLTDVFVDSSIECISNAAVADEFFALIDKLSKSTNVNFHFAITREEEKQIEYIAV